MTTNEAVPVTAEVWRRITDFLHVEARLADGHRFDEWLALWSPEGTYWVPSNDDDYDPDLHVSIIYDDFERMTERCLRLKAGGAHAQEPRSRLCRVVGNVEVESGASAPPVWHVRANTFLMEVRSGVKNVYGAHCTYRLADDGSSLRILLKKVVLIDNDEPLGNLTFLL